MPLNIWEVFSHFSSTVTKIYMADSKTCRWLTIWAICIMRAFRLPHVYKTLKLRESLSPKKGTKLLLCLQSREREREREREIEREREREIERREREIEKERER
jgi:hypothetical protein